MTSISYINHHFRAPSPLKPLKSSSRYENLPGEPLTAHSAQKTANIDHKTGLKQVPGARNLMIFGAIACFRRLESRFSGQNGPRSSEMRVYIEITGYIKNHQNFKILFWSRESKKPIVMIFLDFFTKKIWKICFLDS